MLRISLLLVPALLLVAFVPAPAAAWECIDAKLTKVCSTNDARGRCVTATQFDDATDFGTIEQACYRSANGHCGWVIAGAGTYTGFYGAAGEACVRPAGSEPVGACLYAGFGQVFPVCV